MIEFNENLPDYGHVMTVEEFKNDCAAGGFIDYDGFGQPVKDNKAAKIYIKPSALEEIPQEATHIVWFNR